MKDAFQPAIAALQEDLTQLETKAREIKSAINTLCRHAGIEDMYVISDEKASSIKSIRADTFYGKTIGTAAREYLEMRRTSNLGPATSREIYDALVQGGFQFETANDTNAQISLGNTLRKNSKTFHRLPNGQYGLLAWYPNAKPIKSSSDEDDASETKSAANSKPAADLQSSDASDNDQEADASEPQRERR
jgi:hypothetical protein